MLDLSLLSSYTFFICCQGFSVRRLSKKVYEDNGLKVTAEVNKKVVNFLDVTLDLTTGRHKPYMKPNTTPLYVSSLSNHPPTIIKNIPLEVNRRLASCRAMKRTSWLSSNRTRRPSTKPDIVTNLSITSQILTNLHLPVGEQGPGR